MIFKNGDELFTYLSYLVDNSHHPVDIASYGMYLGITDDGVDWSEIYPSTVRTFINKVAKTDHRVLVGLPYFSACFEGCADCIQKHKNSIRRIQATVGKLHLNARYSTACHMKYYRIGDELIIGSVNLNSSSWANISVVVPRFNDLVELYEDIWNKSHAKADGLFRYNG